MPVASVGPSVASIYGVRAEARRLGLPRHLAVGQEPRHRGAWPRQRGAAARLTIAITNTAGSPLASASDHAIDMLRRRREERRRHQDLRRLGGRRARRCWRTGSTTRRCLPRRARLPEHFRRRSAATGWSWRAALDGTTRCSSSGAARRRRDRQRGGAEVQGNLRHACRGLQRGRGDARAAGAGRDRAFRCWRSPRAMRPKPSMAEAADTLAGKGASVFVTSALRERPQRCHSRPPAIRSPTRWR